LDLTRKKLQQLAIAAQAKQITNIVSKLNKGETLTGQESKRLNQFIDEQTNDENGGRFQTIIEVADHYGVKKQTVFNHVKKGNIRKNPDGTFDKAVTDAYWCDRLGRKKKPIYSKAPVAGEDQSPEVGTIAEKIEKEKLRKLKAEADAKEYFAKQMKGNLVPYEDVIRAWGSRYTMFRDALLSIIDRLPPILVGMDQKEVQETLQKEVESILIGFIKDGKYTPENSCE
jgi:predicted transcriptional regulator